MKIPQSQPIIGPEEAAEVAEVMASTFITENAKTDEFLARIGNLTSNAYQTAVPNGTLALVASLIAIGIRPGDEVIVPDLTFIASANAVILAGGTPVFCDVDPATGCIEPSSCAKLINAKTKAIMPVHLYGQAAEMDSIMNLSIENGVEVIEDAAESLGVFYKGRHTGTFGRFGTFSFFANKLITCGEGGVILSQNEEDFRSLYRIKNHGRDRKGIFVHEKIGYNFCFTDLQAAIGNAQLKKIDFFLSRKRRLFERYRDLLAPIEGATLVEIPAHVESNYWFINILCADPAKVQEFLSHRGIETRRYFYPLHMQPCYEAFEVAPQPNSRYLFNHGLSLPSSPILSDEEWDYVASNLKAFFA